MTSTTPDRLHQLIHELATFAIHTESCCQQHLLDDGCSCGLKELLREAGSLLAAPLPQPANLHESRSPDGDGRGSEDDLSAKTVPLVIDHDNREDGLEPSDSHSTALPQPEGCTQQILFPLATVTAAAHMLRACAEHLEPLAVGYGAEQMRGIAGRLDALCADAKARAVFLVPAAPRAQPEGWHPLTTVVEVRLGQQNFHCSLPTTEYHRVVEFLINLSLPPAPLVTEQKGQ